MAICQLETLLNEEPIGIVLISREGKMRAKIVLCLLIVVFAEDVGRITDNCVKTSPSHNLRVLGLPIEDIDTVAYFLIEETHLFVVIEVWPDKRVSTLN